MKTRRNVSNLAVRRVTLLFLLISLATTAATHPDDYTTPGDDGGHVDEKLDSKLKISEIDTTKVNIDLLNNVTKQRDRTATSIINFQYNEIRNRWLNSIRIPPYWTKGIIYWMYRDQRVQDNWALLYAQKLAIVQRVPLHVVYCTLSSTSKFTLRQYDFMVQGLKKVESELRDLDIKFHFVHGNVINIISDFVINHGIGAIVLDFMPLRDYMNQTKRLAYSLKHRVPVIMVDAHNVIPSWSSLNILSVTPSPIHSFFDSGLKEYLTEFPPVIKHPFKLDQNLSEPINWEEMEKKITIDRSVLPVPNFKAGYREGILELESFLKNRFKNYSRDSVDPMKNGLSNLSPWLNFGQISAQRVLLELYSFSKKYLVDADFFTNEIYKRRERSDYYCYHHQRNYDRIGGTRNWARRALEIHRNDTRQYVYTRDEWENAQTHDDLWNASQLQMKIEGKMHRFMRMYWGKKILEWTDTPENALAISIYLNDKYSLDGSDPNGYNGCMWAICGLHDRPFKKGIDRPVIGPIRFLDSAWFERKFDTVAFIKKYLSYRHTKE